MAIDNFGNKINTNGFDKNPENINRNGRPASIKQELRNALNTEGKITIKAKNVLEVHSNGDVTIQTTQSETLANKLLDWALSRKGNESLKAIQMIMEQVDGKPKQAIEQQTKHNFAPNFKITDIYKPDSNVEINFTKAIEDIKHSFSDSD